MIDFNHPVVDDLGEILVKMIDSLVAIVCVRLRLENDHVERDDFGIISSSYF